MNDAFWLGATVGAIAEIVRSVLKRNTQVGWELALILPGLIAVTFLSGATVEWASLAHSNPASVPNVIRLLWGMIIAGFTWAFATYLAKNIESSGVFVRREWASDNHDKYYSRCGLLYALSILVACIPYIVFSEVLNLTAGSTAWYVVLASCFVGSSVGYFLIAKYICKKWRTAEIEEVQRIANEIFESVIQDRLRQVDFEHVDKRLRAKPIGLGSQDGLLLTGSVERAIALANSFSYRRGKRLVPGFENISLSERHIEKFAEDALTRETALLESRLRVLKLCFGSDAEATEAEALLKQEVCEFTASIEYYKSIRGGIKKSP